MRKGLAVAIVLTLASACAKAPGYSDSAGLIRFAVPESWELKNEEHGMRFVPVGKEERTVLMVKADVREADRSLAKLRETRLAQSRQQGMEAVVDKTSTSNGFQIWEHHSQWDARGLTMHTFHLFEDKVRVEIKLMAKTADYATYRSDLIEVAHSVRAD